MLGKGAPAVALFVAETLRGYAISSCGGGEADLLVIAVDSKYQRRGFGDKLLQMLLDALMQQQVDSLFLEVRSSNIAAIEFYRARGFVEIGLRRGYYPVSVTEREDAVLFKMSLPVK